MTLHDFGLPLTYSDERVPSKEELRKQLAADTEAFYASGGVSYQAKRGESGMTLHDVSEEELQRMPYWNRIEFYRKRRVLLDIEDLHLQDEHVAREERLKQEELGEDKPSVTFGDTK